MKAVTRTTYGPPEVLLVQDIPKPTAKNTELLIRVHATTVNITDCRFLTEKPYSIRAFTGLLKPEQIVKVYNYVASGEKTMKVILNFETQSQPL